MRRLNVGWRELSGVVAVAGFALIGAFALSALADPYSEPEGVPRLITFRGYLDEAGVPMSRAVTLTATIHGHPTTDSVLWGPETHSITAAGGEITLLLGRTVALPDTILAGGDAYLELTVDGTLL